MQSKIENARDKLAQTNFPAARGSVISPHANADLKKFL
jgi:hypothetical protein